MTKFARKIAFVFLAIILLIATCLGGRGNSSALLARAKEVTVEDYEQRNVLDDLEGSTIGGNAFNLQDYAFQTHGRPQVLSLIEYGYSTYENNTDDYGLYVYLYNPQGEPFDAQYNKLQFKAGRATNYTKYDLTVLNYSTKANYEGMFYKFKVALTEEQKADILSNVEKSGRAYTVSGIELSVNGDKTDYAVGSTYTFTGFSMGYGSKLQETDGLTCKVDSFDSYITLDVKQTVYRPQGDYYNGEQAQLNSCFFRVPNVFFEEYGELTKILCEWYEYVTKMALITEDNNLYNALNSVHGNSIKSISSDKAYLLAIVNNATKNIFGTTFASWLWSANVNMDEYYYYPTWGTSFYMPQDNYVDSFSGVFYTGGKSYKDFGVSSADVGAKLKEYSKALGDTSIRGKYAEALFEQGVQEGRTRGYNLKEISSTDEAKVFWNYTTRDWLDKVFGGYNVETIYDAKPAIQIITSDDLNGTDTDISQRLYVNADDVATLKQEFVKAGSTEKLVILRYATSKYFCYPTTVDTQPMSTSADYQLSKDIQDSIRDKDYSAYCAQQTVFLDFDIISLTFTKDNVDTVIPCVANPTDAIGGYTPPLEENYHDEEAKKISTWIWIAVAILVLILLCIFVPPVLRVVLFLLKGLLTILKLLWRLICAPFKAIYRAIKERQQKKAKTPKKTAQSSKDKPVKSASKTTSSKAPKASTAKKAKSKEYKPRKPTPIKRKGKK